MKFQRTRRRDTFGKKTAIRVHQIMRYDLTNQSQAQYSVLLCMCEKKLCDEIKAANRDKKWTYCLPSFHDRDM